MYAMVGLWDILPKAFDEWDLRSATKASKGLRVIASSPDERKLGVITGIDTTTGKLAVRFSKLARVKPSGTCLRLQSVDDTIDETVEFSMEDITSLGLYMEGTHGRIFDRTNVGKFILGGTGRHRPLRIG